MVVNPESFSKTVKEKSSFCLIIADQCFSGFIGVGSPAAAATVRRRRMGGAGAGGSASEGASWLLDGGTAV